MSRPSLCQCLLATLAIGAAGCSFLARSPTRYRDDTVAVLAQAAGDIKGCYDGVLKTNGSAQGTVMVQFTVDKETGKLSGARADDKGTTAPAELSECVTKAIDGLTLSPPDAREGQATFVYQFEIAPRPAPAPTQPAPSEQPAAPAPTQPAP